MSSLTIITTTNTPAAVKLSVNKGINNHLYLHPLVLTKNLCVNSR